MEQQNLNQNQITRRRKPIVDVKDRISASRNGKYIIRKTVITITDFHSPQYLKKIAETAEKDRQIYLTT